MRTLTTLLLLFLSLQIAKAQYISTSVNNDITAIEVLSDNGHEVVVKATMGPLQQREVTTPRGLAIIPNLSKGTPLLERGMPDLPKLTASVIIPEQGISTVTIIDAHYTEFHNISVAPSKGNLYRNQNPSSIPYTYGPVYGQDAFFPAQLATLRDPFILRDQRGLSVVFNPMQYNPVTRVLRVYQDITVSVRTSGNGGINTIDREVIPERTSVEYRSTYARHFLNYSPSSSRYTAIPDEGDLLIVCHPAFMDEMEPFVAWKRQKGIPTSIVSFASVGTTAAQLKDYVAQHYANNGLTFLLLVGDFEQIPAVETAYGFSDNAFGYISGDDAYPEIIVGRFSAETGTHVTTMVNRSIRYEKFAQTDSGNNGAGWYARAMGIASQEGADIGDDNEIDFEHSRNIGNKLLNFTYTDYVEMYEGSQGGTDAAEDPTYQMVANAVNQGLGFVNYTGHGSMNQCGTSGFSDQDADNLTNVGQYPFWVAVACQNGVFFGGTCIAEAMARSEHNGQPAGSIGFYGATINQSWAPPMAGQDEMTDILVRTYPDNIQRSIGGIGINGIMQTLDDYGNGGVDVMDTWVLFGDPTAHMRTANPATLTVNHTSSTPLVTQQLSFTSPTTPDAFIALTVNGDIIGTGHMTNGLANISITALTSLDPIIVTGTAFNTTTYLGEIAVTAAEGPFVSENAHVVNDVFGNSNAALDYNETAMLNVSLANLGLSTANGVQATIATTSPYITITDGQHTWGDITNGDQLLATGAYAVQVADNVPDQHVAVFTITITDTDGNTWTSAFSLTVNAPALSCGAITVTELVGNGNERPDNNESLLLAFVIENTGHAAAENLIAQFQATNAHLIVDITSVQLGTLNAGTGTIAQFNATVASNVPSGEMAAFTVAADASTYGTSCDFTQSLNLVIEDWESNDFDQHEWSTYGGADWFITEEQPFAGLYCNRSGAIADGGSTMLELTMDSILQGQSISFARKVSTEEGWDLLRFYIDESLVGEWSGELSWEVVSFDVTAGAHTFTWEYYKDAECCTGGSDAAWVDDIILPQTEQVEVVNPNSIVSIDATIGFSVHPNPTEQAVSLDLALPFRTPVNIALFDTQGRLVQTLYNGTLDAGTHRIVANAPAEAGIYLLHLSSELGTLSERLTVVN